MKTLRIIAGYYVDELAEAECEQTALDKVIDASVFNLISEYRILFIKF